MAPGCGAPAPARFPAARLPGELVPSEAKEKPDRTGPEILEPLNPLKRIEKA